MNQEQDLIDFQRSLDGWSKVPIKDICQIGRGRVISEEEIERHPGVYPVYSSQSKDKGILGYLDTYDFEGDYVTWTTDGAHAGTVFFRTGRFNCTNVCGTLKPISDETDARFLARALSQVAKKYVSYVGNPKLMNNVVAAISLLIPRPDEQRRIAFVLDTIDELIAKTEAVIAKLKQVRAGLLHDLLTRGLDENGELRDPVAHPEQFKDSPLGRIPKEWEVELLKDLVQEERRITYGIVQPGAYDTKGVLLIRGQDYINGWQPVETYFKVSRTLHNSYLRSLTKGGDVLMCIVGATTGAVNQVPSSIEEANITQTTARIACKERKLHSRFCLHVLKSNIGQSQVRKYRKGSAQPGLNLKDVEIFQHPIPPIDEQREIAKRIDKQEETINAFEEEYNKLSAIKSGLMSDLLTGRVRVPVSVVAGVAADVGEENVKHD